MMAKIMLNPGHGGDDPGAVVNNVREVDLVLSVANKVAPILRGLGHSVEIFQSSSTQAILNRTKAVNPDVFVSIHVNAGVFHAQGYEVWIRGADFVNAKRLADITVANYGFATKLVSRGVKVGRLYVLSPTVWRSYASAVLLELGFLTNRPDRGYMTSPTGKQEMARGIASSIRQHLRELII